MNSRLLFLVGLIIDEYFSNFHCTFLISESKIDVRLLLTGKIAFVNYRSNSPSSFNLDGFCQGFLIVSKRPSAILNRLEEKALNQVGIWSFATRRYLLVPLEEENDVFNQSTLEYVSDLLVVAKKNKEFHFHTHKFSGKDNYHEPVLLDRWFLANQSFLQNANLYPDKFANLEGKNLRLSTFSYPLFNNIGETLEKSNGFEVSLLLEFLGRKNLTPVVIDAGDDGWGDFYENGTGINGIKGDVQKRKSEIGFALILMWFDYKGQIEITVPITSTRQICLVPRPKSLDNWNVAFNQFTLPVWLLIIVSMVGSAMVLVFIMLLKNADATHQSFTFKESLFQMFGVLVQQNSIGEGHFYYVKIVVVLISFLTLIMSSLYNSNLSSRMIVPRYEKLINTVNDLVQSKLPWGSVQKHLWMDALLNDGRTEYRQLVRTFVWKNESELVRLASAGLLGLPIDQLSFSGTFGLIDGLNETSFEKLYPMQQAIYEAYSIMLVRKNLVFLPPLNDFILRANQYGLVKHWETQAVLGMQYQHQYLLRYFGEKLEHVPLSWKHVKGAFFLWLTGTTLSTLAFVREILRKRKLKANE